MIYLKKYILCSGRILIRSSYKYYGHIKICRKLFAIVESADSEYLLYMKNIITPLPKVGHICILMHRKNISSMIHDVYPANGRLLVSDYITRYEIYCPGIADIIEDITEYNEDNIVINIHR